MSLDLHPSPSEWVCVCLHSGVGGVRGGFDLSVTHRDSERAVLPLARPSLLLFCSPEGQTNLSSSYSVAVCRFPNTGDDWYVLVGVARDMILNPKSVAGGFIYTYRLVSGGEKLEFVHKVGSPVNAVPSSWSAQSPAFLVPLPEKGFL